MTKLDHALALAAAGFWIFPLWPYDGAPGKRRPGKTPRAAGWQAWATRDAEKIADHWRAHPDDNIGIYTAKYGDGSEALLVVDVDNKNGKRGDDEIFFLELRGLDLPETLETATPSGGRHLFYRVSTAVRQGANVLGAGLDIRSRGGYVVGAGSTVDGRPYIGRGDHPVAHAPQWLVDRCGGAVRERAKRGDKRVLRVDGQRAVARVERYLVTDAPVALEGEGGDDLTYRVAARVKDMGVDEPTALSLLAEHWNPRCQPPWGLDDLATKVRNAYSYGQEPQGVAAPEADFTPVTGIPVSEEEPTEKGSPHAELNKEFAFVIAGGGSHILWETTDARGRFQLEHLSELAFHKKFASVKFNGSGKKECNLTVDWMEWEGRRSYDGLVFMPGRQAPPRFYNLWRGFAVEPLAPGETPTAEAQAALDAFIEHARLNVCRGDEALYRWLIGYFAHLVQRPYEKPLVALVFRGGKGVGKNALVERIGDLLGNHFLLSSNRRYLTGNFNGHLENCLLFALDEAFWSGEKQIEGTIKDLITGKSHVIEHKGKEPYTVDNLTRIIIIGNEDWLVPASHDERRYAVFDVGDGRKQDRTFFQSMRERMEAGGSRLLLRYLLDFDLAGFDPNGAPTTGALLDQKHASLGLVEAWWLNCLEEGRVIASGFGAEWPDDEVDRARFRDAFGRYVRDRNTRGRVPDMRELGKTIKRICPAIRDGRARRDGKLPYTYTIPPLAECRAAWEKFIGHAEEWPQE